MTTPVRQVTDHPPVAQVLVCRLRKKTEGRSAGSPLAGEVELENVSTATVEIPVRSSPLQHLNLVVTDAQDRVVSEGHYGDLFSPAAGEMTLRLLPGEKYVWNVSFLATVPEERRLPGTYLVHAIYEYQGVRAVSPPYLLELGATQG